MTSFNKNHTIACDIRSDGAFFSKLRTSLEVSLQVNRGFIGISDIDPCMLKPIWISTISVYYVLLLPVLALHFDLIPTTIYNFVCFQAFKGSINPCLNNLSNNGPVMRISSK